MLAAFLSVQTLLNNLKKLFNNLYTFDMAYNSTWKFWWSGFEGYIFHFCFVSLRLDRIPFWFLEGVLDIVSLSYISFWFIRKRFFFFYSFYYFVVVCYWICNYKSKNVKFCSIQQLVYYNINPQVVIKAQKSEFLWIFPDVSIVNLSFSSPSKTQ